MGNTYQILSRANLDTIDENDLLKVKGTYDAIVINTFFRKQVIGKITDESQVSNYVQTTKLLIEKTNRLLNDGGLMFVYGLPNYLSYLAEYLEKRDSNTEHYLFKYWIACEFSAKESISELPCAHIGILMFLKSKKSKTITPFSLNTKYVRIPYTICSHCGQNTKDWGGKKHLLNPLGTAISDVWHYNNIPISETCTIPDVVIERILLLLSEGKSVLRINQKEILIPEKIPSLVPQEKSLVKLKGIDTVVYSDCVKYLKELKELNPQGSFDLAFADPPYNLSKNYSTYNDDKDAQKYIDWCNEWLNGMCDNLRPGGALLVLNIPKWAIHHFVFLNSKMLFKNWIVWDALSTPAGKLLPAHYSLLYFVKNGGKPTVNITPYRFIDSREYCLRANCIKTRKALGEDNKELLTDIWSDVYRIKHKKDRDHHPCQLPTKLMERIIDLFSNEGDIIFDPFGGAGTTAIAAKLKHRHFVITELDKEYVDIARRNIGKIATDLMGNLYYQRESVSNSKSSSFAKSKFERSYIDLCIKGNKVYSEEDLAKLYPDLFALLPKYAGNFHKLKTFTKRKIDCLNQIKP